MTDRELMQMALDWLDDGCGKYTDEYQNLIEALRARLAQPEPEPVAWFMEGTFEDGTPSFTQVCESDPEFYVPLYTAPPQRDWQGLTDDDIRKLSDDCAGVRDETEFIRAIEAKLKEKNT